MKVKYKKPQIKAPRVTPLKGVSTHGDAMRVCGVENPQGFGIDERRFVHKDAFRRVINNKQEVIKKIGEIISKFDDVDIAYIFGSFLESEKFEDIDVGLVLNKELSPYERFKFSMRAARELERKIEPRFEFDVKILNYSPVEFQHEVLKKGRLVFSRDEDKRIEFESRLLSTYLDHKAMYDFLDNAFLARV